MNELEILDRMEYATHYGLDAYEAMIRSKRKCKKAPDDIEGGEENEPLENRFYDRADRLP